MVASLRIAYVCHNDAFATDGVNRKVAAQVALWGSAGHDAHLLVLSPAPKAPRPPVMDARVFAFAGLADRARATLALARAVRRLRPDVVYLRHHKFLPPLTPLLWPLPVVVEVNSDDRAELAVRSRLGWLYNELERGVTFRQAAGLTAVTHELARAEDFAPYGKPVIVVANGVDARLVDPVPAPHRRDRPRAVLLAGAVGVWTGVDRAVALARAAPELDLHLVGPGVGDGLRPLPANVHEHGLLGPAEYRRLLAEADFGLGPLALDRLGLREASPLKVREYLLHGLPVLTAHEDTDFPGAQPWFLLRVDGIEHGWAPHLGRVRSWVAEIRGRRVPREDVEPRLSLERKEADRLAFVRRVVDASRVRPRVRRAMPRRLAT